MQIFPTTFCSNRGDGFNVAQRTLYDVRDNNGYAVAKLADGKCWMVGIPLKLAGPRTLTSDDSDVSANFALSAPNTDKSASTWCTDATTACLNKNLSVKWWSNSDVIHYNFYTATAGTGKASLTSGTASASVCPKGWRLPTGSSSGEYQQLWTVYGSGMYDAPGDYRGSAYGYILGGALQGSQGNYWSSTIVNYMYVGSLYYNYNGIAADASNTYRYVGATIHCVAK